jgi:hypothetical protein
MCVSVRCATPRLHTLYECIYDAYTNNFCTYITYLELSVQPVTR